MGVGPRVGGGLCRESKFVIIDILYRITYDKTTYHIPHTHITPPIPTPAHTPPPAVSPPHRTADTEPAAPAHPPESQTPPD